MRRFWLSFLAAIVLGVAWAGLVGLLSWRLQGPAIAFPVFTFAFWFVFLAWGWLRFVGFFAILPFSILGFEILETVIRPSLDVHQYVTLDRAHFLMGERIRMPEYHVTTAPGRAGWGEKEVLIGNDGFRADPESGVGNPARCRWALIGDSVIFGSGLPYHETLGPTLKNIGLDACVFGVGGNGPVNYLATLRYIKDRLEPGADVAIYLTENDFLWTFHELSPARWWWALADLVGYYEYWRRATFTFRLVNGRLVAPSAATQVWELKIGSGEPVKLLSDPAVYVSPASLSPRQLRYLDFFFKSLLDLTKGQPWRVTVVILPSGREILANFALGNLQLRALDKPRLEALEMCQAAGLACGDFSAFLYARAIAEGKNPYFLDDKAHYSAFGTRVLAEHYREISKGLLAGRK